MMSGGKMRNEAVLLVARGVYRNVVQNRQSRNEMAYSERRVVGYSKEEMFDVVARIDQYSLFVPWCRRSTVKSEGDNVVLADLEVGFPPIDASYLSRVTFIRPTVVHSVCVDPDGGLFRLLDTTWRFSDVSFSPSSPSSFSSPSSPSSPSSFSSPSSPSSPSSFSSPSSPSRSCRVHFDLEFAFRSALHAKITHIFFDKVVQKMVSAFLSRAESIYGPPSRPASPPQVLRYDS